MTTGATPSSGSSGPTVICWTIWFAVNWDQGNGGPQFDAFPWPLIVMAVTMLNFLRVATNRREIVAAEVRRLERKQAKAIESQRKKQSGP